jgi:hypothetical protein
MIGPQKRRKEGEDKMQRKKFFLAVLSIALLIGVVSAALLAYYGRIETSVTVGQSVLLDGFDVNGMPIYDTINAIGGDKVCKYHWLWNRASVPATVELVSWGAPEGATVKYYAMGTSTTWHVIPSGGAFDQVEAYITKTDKATSVEFKVEIVPVAPHYGMGIAISTSRSRIDFQVWYKEYDPTDYGWHYQEYGTGWGSMPEQHLPYLGITATGDYTGKVFTVDIPIELLGGCGAEYYFAIQFRTTLLGTYPQGLNLWAQTNASLFAAATVGTIPAMPITLEPGEVLPFYICYEFDIAMAPATFTIYTEVRPA